MAAANNNKALLLTADKDFGELVHRFHRISEGIVLIRLAGLTPAGKAGLISSVVHTHGERLINTFTVVTPGVVRIRPKII